MELRDITMDDLPLYRGTLTDPDMMAELGGPLPPDGLADKLRSIVDDVQAGRVWYFTIVPDPEDGVTAGTVCVWDHEWDGQTISEIGWMMIPEFQGRGLASEAVRAVLDRARSGARWEAIHAFPATTNAPSNAICRKSGFSKVGELDYEYSGRSLRCNHWRIDLARR